MELIEAASIDLQTAIGDAISGSANRLGRRGVCGSTIFQVPVRSDYAWNPTTNASTCRQSPTNIRAIYPAAFILAAITLPPCILGPCPLQDSPISRELYSAVRPQSRSILPDSGHLRALIHLPKHSALQRADRAVRARHRC